MGIVTVTTKGQIAIPAKTRKLLGIVKGTRLYVEERGDEIVLRPLTSDYLEKTAGILKQGNRRTSLSKKLLRERTADRKRDR